MNQHLTSPVIERNAPIQQFQQTRGVDHRRIRWERVRQAGYLIHQRFTYVYPGKIHQLRQQLVVVPPERHGDQRLITHHLDVSSPTTEVRRSVDRFGNLVLTLLVDTVTHEIDFTVWIVIEREAGGKPFLLNGSGNAVQPFQEPTPLTEPTNELRDVASQLLSEGLTPQELASRINGWTHQRLSYAHGVTGVKTTAAQALEVSQGVCQDYAHIMLSICRLCRLPARYVSGHLLGEGGTHAWVEVLLPESGKARRLGVQPFDPTHNSIPGLNYLTIAVGRDYRDVAPTSGTYRAPFAGELSASKRAAVTAIDYFPDTE